MVLARDVYRAFEDIVGKENISDEPAVLDSYSYHFGAEGIMGPGNKWLPRPEAVLLPNNTEEVQAIVKLCNRYKVKFKAFSTGWGPWNAPGGPGVIQLDMRRMNRIVEINEKEMYAVVEPYVISAQLQAELMKRGLNCNIIGGGSNTTALTATKFFGAGWQGYTTGFEGRNLLATEWVLPTGEVLKLGSLGSGAGWFCSDGPGPSLRGAVRGMLSAFGGMGVFTKCATKVYPWPGPATLPVEGTTPWYTIKPMKWFKAWHLSFPFKDFANAGYKIAEAEIAYVFGKWPPYHVWWDLTTSNEEAMRLRKKLPYLDKVGSYLVIIGAQTQAEFDYKEKVLNLLIKETGAVSLDLLHGCDEQGHDMQGRTILHVIRASFHAGHAFRPTGSFHSSFGTLESIDLGVNQVVAENEIMKKHLQKGLITDMGEETCWGIIYDGGHLCHMEGPIFGHPGAKGQKGIEDFTLDADKAAIDAERKYHSAGAPLGIFRDARHEMFGPHMLNYHLWQRKLKKAFDPNNVSESTHYITPKE